MSEPVSGATGGWRNVAVGVFWQPYPDSYPQVTASWDGDKLDREMAATLFHAIDDNPDFENAREFIDSNPRPWQWRTPEDVRRWLEALQMEVAGPAWHSETQHIQVDPAVGNDLTVAVVRWGVDVWDETTTIVGTDPNQVERDLASAILDRLDSRDGLEGGDDFLDVYGKPDLGDPQSVFSWLAAARRELEYPIFTTHHTTVEPDTSESSTKAMASAIESPSVGQTELSALASTVSDAPGVEPGPVVTVGVIWWTNSGDIPPEIVVGADRAGVELGVAERLWGEMRDSEAFADGQELLDQLGDPTGMDSDGISAWLAGYQKATWLPEIRVTAMDAETFAALSEQAVNQAILWRIGPPEWERDLAVGPESGAGPGRPGVDAGRLSAGVIVWDDENPFAPVEMEVIIGTDHAAMVRKMAVRLFEEASYSAPSDAVADYLERTADPGDLDADELGVWLEGLREVMPHPQFTCHPILSASTLPPAATSEPAAGSTPTPEAEQRLKVLAEDGQTAQETWGDLLDSGVPERLANVFPAMPQLRDWPELDGTQGGDLWEAAVEDWREECLTLADHMTLVPDLVERLAGLERFRDKTAEMLTGEPLPAEPNIADYMATRPDYEGQFDDVAYRWNHDQWKADLPKAARYRDTKLALLLQDSYDAAPQTSPLARTDGLEKARVEAVKQLIVPDDTGTALGESWLDQDSRRQVSRIIADLGDRPVIVPCPKGHLYSGYGRSAHGMLEPGVYEATSIDGEQHYRLVVGQSSKTGGTGWAIVVDPYNRDDQAALDKLVRLRAQAIGNKQTGTKPDATVDGPGHQQTVDARVKQRPERSWFGQTSGRPTPGMSL